MITVPTRKGRKSPFKTLKDLLCLYMWTSNSHCPNPQQKKYFEKVKMNTEKSTSIQESSTIYAILLQDFNEKECLQVCSGDALRG